MTGRDVVIGSKWREVTIGARVRWTTPSFVKRGTVTFRAGTSMKVWLDGDDKETVIPWARDYWDQYRKGRSDYGLVDIEGGKKTVIVTAPGGNSDPAIHRTINILDVAAIANLLGTDEKNVRRKLRSGKLKGFREGGHWYMMRKDMP